MDLDKLGEHVLPAILMQTGNRVVVLELLGSVRIIDRAMKFTRHQIVEVSIDNHEDVCGIQLDTIIIVLYTSASPLYLRVGEVVVVDIPMNPQKLPLACIRLSRSSPEQWWTG